MFGVLTGFAALTIDAGVSYDQSRSDQDVADSAALAASYWVAQNQSASDTLTQAFAVAQNVANLDCNGPSSSCPVSTILYATSGQTTVLCSGTSTSNNCGSDNPTQVGYVGAAITNTANDYFAHLDPASGRTHSIAAQAEASVFGTGGGSGGTTSGGCEICILNSINASNSLTMGTTHGDIDVNNSFTVSGGSCTITSAGATNLPPGTHDSMGPCSASSFSPAATYKTGTGWMLAKWPAGGSGSTSWPAGDPLQGLRLGSLGSYTSGTVVMATTMTTTLSQNSTYTSITVNNMSETLYSGTTLHVGSAAGPAVTVNNNTSTNTIPISSWTDTTATYPAGTPLVQVSTSSDWSSPSTGGTFEVTPGTFYGISTASGGNVTLEFDPGIYIFYGPASTSASTDGGLSLQGGTVTLYNTPTDSGGVTFYFTCNSGNAPANCSAGTVGADFDASPSNLVLGTTADPLYAPTSGIGANMLFWFDPNDSNLSSSSCNPPSNQPADCLMTLDGNPSTSMTGALYMASGTLFAEPSSSSGLKLPGSIVVNTLTIGGGANSIGTPSGAPVGGTQTGAGNLVK
jgi:hypothetical protein